MKSKLLTSVALHRCSGISLSAATLAGIISFFNPDFVAQQWQVYLLYVATAVITRMHAPKVNTETILTRFSRPCLHCLEEARIRGANLAIPFRPGYVYHFVHHSWHA